MSEKTIGDAFKYPFNAWTRLFNFWWVLIPILGWFAVVGYFKKIIKQMLKKDFKELPKFGSLIENFKDGFFFFLVMLVPFILFGMLMGILSNILDKVLLGWLVYFILTLFLDLLVSILFVNYVKKDEYEAVFDVKKAWNILSKDWGDTVMVILKQFVVALLLVLLSIPIVTLVVTIPAMVFVGYYFIVDLYIRRA